MRSAFYYDASTAEGAQNQANVALVANRLYAVPVFVEQDTPIDTLAINVASGTGNLRFGVYYPTSSGLPGALLSEAGTVAVTAAFKTVSASITLPAGYSFLALESDSTPTVAHFQAAVAIFGTDGASVLGGCYVAHTYGTLPSDFGSPTFQTVAPRIMFRVA